MKNTWKTRILALVLCLTILTVFLPITASAESAQTAIEMTEGDVQREFVPAGTECTSSDPSIAWVDEDGTLNALKPGTVTITVPGKDDSTVTVSDFSDGSPIVGNLKLLARYNDSMQFYDGHVYLLFTSYQDDVTITVPDLYAAYEIKDEYYDTIYYDLSIGSNHTNESEDDVYRYFSEATDNKSVTLDRGEIVTIGMYRDFDLSVPQAALGSIQNSSLWSELKAAGKAAAIQTIFRFLDSGQLSTDEAVAQIKAVFDEAGLDYNRLLDGVVGGGVCFNRELYNQKLEWDQYENVTYEMDITENQLRTMTMYLGGNLNKFSILKNSCATVALRAWNAAVGTTNGEPNAYYLTSSGEGILSIIDAPKGVRDSIVKRLPGYYLNNSEGVAEPDAGYEDMTGWVYVSAPEAVDPAYFFYEDDDLSFDVSKTKLSTLVKAAKGDQKLVYTKEEQQIDVSFDKTTQDGLTTVNSADFTVNGTTVTLDSDNFPEEGVWFQAWVGEPDDGLDHYLVDADGNALASEYEDGIFSFYADSLPVSYRIAGSSEGTRNLLRTVIVNENDANIDTEVYTLNGSEKTVLNKLAEVKSGEKIYIKNNVADDEYEYMPADITLNGESVFNGEYYDPEQHAYCVTMPENYSVLTVTYCSALVTINDKSEFQLPVGGTLNAADVVTLSSYDAQLDPANVAWMILDNDDNAVEIDGGELTAVSEGRAVLWAFANDNENIGVMIFVNVYDSDAEMVKVTFDDTTYNGSLITVMNGEEEFAIPYSGYLVKKGTELNIQSFPEEGKEVLFINANGKKVNEDGVVVANADTEIKIRFTDAVIKNMPEEIALAAKGDTYQLNAKAQYKGIYSLLPMYNDSVTYSAYDPLVTVDESGLVTVAGDIPEGGAIVYIFATTASETVSAYTKVVLGDYAGSAIVGKMTIHARRIDQGQLIAHGCVTFTTYQDLDLDTSFYHYYRPTDAYNDYMIDYEAHPENYTSDPALYSMNELGLEDRESYFDTISNGAGSDPYTISLVAGESITISNYGYDSTNITAIRRALEDSTLASNSRETQELVRQMKLYSEGGDYDGEVAFDSLVATLIQIYSINSMTGQNPADGHSEGGQDINRELFNQFRRNDSQLPNNYYTVEITADELAQLKAYLANPDNNYYSFMAKNCATGSVDLWNTTLFDRPELHLKGNLTGMAADPQSLYFDIGALTLKTDIDGYGGSDFYPRSVRYSDAVRDTIEKIAAIGTVEYTAESKAKIDAAREAFDALNDSEKERVWNYTTLTDAEAAYDELDRAEDVAAFEAYKAELIEDADELAQEDDSILDKALIAAAKAAIGLLEYNDSLSLDENKAAADAILEQTAQLLAMQRLNEHPILGDVDGNGIVEATDITYIQRYLALMDTPLFRFELMRGDVDGSGELDLTDVTYIQYYLAGMETPYPIGEPIV